MSKVRKAARADEAFEKGSGLEHISEPLRALAVPTGTLHADEANVRTHPARNIEAIKASLERFGQQAAAVYVRRGRRRVVIKGNGLLAAARELGWKRLAAVESGLPEMEARAYAIADNRTTDLSEFDAKLLAAQLQELEEADVDIEAIGYTDEELQDLVEGVDEPPGRPVGSGAQAGRNRGERTALFVVGHLKFELSRASFDRWMAAIEGKVGNDPDRVVAEIKRRLKIG